MTILYKVHNNLYVNLTNKCPCSCTFCLRQTMDHVGESDSLWLTREPEYDEIIADFANFDVASFDELVFCGFGEPTERIDVLLKVARYFKETYHKRSVSIPTVSAILSMAATLHRISKD